MLEKLGCSYDISETLVKISECDPSNPFNTGLEYGAPARGTWNIVHTGMLLPQGHQIYVCAAACLRGVVLTAAEMGTSERFSTVAIRDNNILNADMEELIIDGVSDIVDKLEVKPRAVLVYTSCIHHFMACDLERVYKVLNDKYPDIDFTDCYMNPIMRKSGHTPDQLMRRQLYSLWKYSEEKDSDSVNIIGNDFATDESSELMQILYSSGKTVKDITRMDSYDEYLSMGKSFLNVVTYPSALLGAKELGEKFKQEHIYVPFAFDYDTLDANYSALCDKLGIDYTFSQKGRENADKALAEALDIIKDTPVCIDYTAFSRPLELAKLLFDNGFNVCEVYLDAITGEDLPAFNYLKEKLPELILRPTVHTSMRVQPRGSKEKVLAIGQKAAYFTNTQYFVNVVEDGGMHGYDGICRLAELMTEAYLNPKDTKKLIQIKGLGCGGCA